MTRRVLVGVGSVWLGVWCLHGAESARAAGELQGRELRPARDLQTGVESGLETLLGGLLGGHRPPAGRIESVVVTEDGVDRLTVSVTCSGDLDGRQVRGELQGKDHRSQRQFRPAQVRLERGAREAELSFESTGGVADDTLHESAYLRVSVDGGGPAQAFVLGKVWGVASGGGGRGASVVRVKAMPEQPLTAALPSTEPTPFPQFHAQPVVRDHRGEAGGGVVVRDQGARPRGGGEVRDHRGETRGGEVGDHRRPAPTVEVRDHRTAPATAAVSPSQRQAFLARTATVVSALPQTGKLYTLDPNVFSLSASDQAKGARGPNLADQRDLLDDLAMDGMGLEDGQVVNIGPTVFGDQDPSSGNFYFVPAKYHLGWLADRGRYDMAMNYLAAKAPGSQGEVQMAAGLTAGIDRDEIRVAEALLSAYCHRHPCPPTPQLRPLPIDPNHVAVSLPGTLSLFNIPADKVAPVGLSSALSDFRLTWATDPVTKENVQLVLEQAGINGNVTFAPQGAAQSGALVNVEIKLADPGSFARAPWRRGQAWRNPAPFPVRVKYLHALVLGPDNRPTVYSWSLGGATVAPGGRVECDASAVPSWIDGKALRMWVGYAVVEDCAACTQQVLKAITGGVSSVAASQVTLHTMNPIAEMGAYEIAVRVRSKRFDPEGRETTEKSIVLKADNQDFTLGPIYVGEQAGEASDALFEYFVTVAMADGTQHEARRWIPSSDLRVLIGRSQIEKALGFLPGGPAVPESRPTPAPDRP